MVYSKTPAVPPSNAYWIRPNVTGWRFQRFPSLTLHMFYFTFQAHLVLKPFAIFRSKEYFEGWGFWEYSRYSRFEKADICMVYVITTSCYVTIRLQQLERFPLRANTPSWGFRSRKKMAIPGSICVEMQCTSVLCSPGCLSANVVVGAGVFLFVIRGHSLRYELWSAKAEIQYMLSGGAESEGGSPIRSDFHTQKKKANSADFTDPWHLIDLSWKCICGTWRTNLFILITSNKPRSCKTPVLLSNICYVPQIKMSEIPTAETGWECLEFLQTAVGALTLPCK